MNTEAKYDYFFKKKSTLDFMENIMKRMEEVYKDAGNEKVDYKTDVRVNSIFEDIEALRENI